MKNKQFQYLVILGIFAIGFALINPGNILGTQTEVAPQPQPTTTTPARDNCPTDGITTLNVALKNNLNTSTEYLAQTWQVFKNTNGGEQLIGSVTTNAGSTQSYATKDVDCGQSYTLYPISDDDANAKLKSTSGGQLSSDGKSITVDADSNNAYIQAIGTKHGDDLEVRAWDYKNSAYIYGSGESSNTNWVSVADGGAATFQSTSDNSSAVAVGANEYIENDFQIRTGASYQDANDLGLVIAIDAGTSAASNWNAPRVQWNGETLQEATDQLTDYEAKRFSGGDWYYIIPADDVTGRTMNKLYVYMLATSNDPTADITTTIASRGQFLNSDESGVLTGAADDTSSYGKVVSEWKIVRDIS